MLHQLKRVSVCCLALSFLYGCGDKIEPGNRPAAPGKTVTARTAATEIIRRPFQYEAVGTVRARQESTLSSKLMGTVASVRVSEGDRVKAGEILAVIEQVQVDAGLRQARAAREEARRAYAAAVSGREAAEADARLAATTYERYRKLMAKDSASRQEFDEIKARYQEAQASLARAEAMVKAAAQRVAQAEAGLDSAAATRNDSEIRAPYDGLITAKPIQAGDLASPGTPLFSIEGNLGFRVDLVLPETYLSAVSTGQKLRVTLPAPLDAAVEGTVQAVIPTADASSRTFLVKVELPDDLGLRSGLFARVAIPVGEEGQIRVPKTAIVTSGQLTAVFKVDDENIARFRLVRLGRSFGDQVEVISGLGAGERYVTAPPPETADGVRVEDPS
jgi:multidrug efflux pump subunit AcrA (membrane-fusion protein)